MKRILIILLISIAAFLGFIFYTSPVTPKVKPPVDHAKDSLEVYTPLVDVLIDYEDYINESLRLSGTPGAAVAIVQDSSIVFLKGFGVKNVDTQELIDTHTIFRLASVSKSVSSVLMGILVEDSVFAWDDPIVKFLPEFQLNSKEYTETVSIKNVLSHTTGLPYHTYTNLIEEGRDHKALIEELKNVKMIGAPGKIYSYQNVAYSIIDDVVLAATGHTYADEMKTRLFGPLRMANASVSYEDLVYNDNKAQPHLFRGRKWKPIPISSTYYNTAPAGGINASISDMGKLLVALLGFKEEVISKQTIDQLFAPVARATAKNRNFNRWSRIKRSYYGLGWRVLNFKNDTIAYHGGYVNGFRSEIAVHPAKRIAICVLANGPSSFSDHAIPAFLKIYDKYYKPNISIKQQIAP